MQVAVIEYARNVVGLTKAHSTEFVPDAQDPVIGLITEWMDESGRQQIRGGESDMGGTMRLGGQKCQLETNTLAHQLYQQDVISERHRHRYEFNNHYLSVLEDSGLQFSGRSMDGQLVEMIEIPDHPWFLACQFHPEFTSTPRRGHPVFSGFVEAAAIYKKTKESQE
jgi:CTP synthase